MFALAVQLLLVIKAFIVVLAIVSTGYLWSAYARVRGDSAASSAGAEHCGTAAPREPPPRAPPAPAWRLLAAGFVANVLDTLGVGSYAVIVALNRPWRLCDDGVLPGTLVAHGALSVALEALVFMTEVRVDVVTLLALSLCSVAGGALGGRVMARVPAALVRRIMFVAYVTMTLLLGAALLQLLPIGGELDALHGVSLLLGAVALFGIGVLSTAGVGAFAPTQLALFALGMRPLAAFPIMTCAGALRGCVASLAFVAGGGVDVRAAALLQASGAVGVLVTAPFVAGMRADALRVLLLAVLVFNDVSLGAAVCADRRAAASAAAAAAAAAATGGGGSGGVPTSVRRQQQQQQQQRTHSAQLV